MRSVGSAVQVPFSDPVADGHTLVNACYEALKHGGSVQATLDLASRVSARHPEVTFVLMSYLNPLYRFGLQALFEQAAAAGITAVGCPQQTSPIACPPRDSDC